MSALARTKTHNTDTSSVQLNSEPVVTSISVSARIDYIQRFSKQAVLVIDNDTDAYTQAARQFLINLSKEKATQETNAAFVSASVKLNDIQMRCRLIEQLFGNTLFDPEKSLAVSILRLCKQSKGSITIVVEHAHALSLQVKYELCQLVDVANKTNNKINVALFGQEQAAQTVANNKSIFNNKLAIIDAKSGQLFAFDHARFKHDRTIFTNKFWKKLILSVASIATIIGLSWFVLIEYDNFTLSKLPLFNAAVNEQVTIINDSKTPIARIEKQAGVEDIHAALLGKVSDVSKDIDKSAKTTDILQALNLEAIIDPKSLVDEPERFTKGAEQAKEVKVKSDKLEQVKVAQVNKSVNTNSPLEFTPNYYLNSPAGYVVQIVGFNNMTLLSRFIDQYPNLEYFSYQKKLNGQLFAVLTTKVFVNKEQARQFYQALPTAIVDNGVWVKALSSIKAEINAFN